MALWDSLQEILFTLRQNKLRTFLTAFGVFWGIFLLILLLGAGQGLKNGAQAGFGSNESNVVWIWARKSSVPYKGLQTGRHIFLDTDDIDAIKREITDVKTVSAEQRLWGNTLITHAKRSGNFDIYGIGHDFFKIKSGLEYFGGRKLHDLDNEEIRKVSLIGSKVKENLFPNSSPVGKYIRINNVSFLVVGVFHDDEGNGRNSIRVYIPSTLYQKTFGKGLNRVSTIAYLPNDGVDSKQVEKDVIALLKKRHRVAPSDKAAIRSYNLQERVEKTNALFAGINAFIWFVGIGTLTAGIVGISNIMMITVKERTVEIGIRKALGARPTHIISSLLFESVFVTAIAGYMGLVFGVGVIELASFSLEKFNIQNEFFKRPEVDFAIAIQAIIILVLVGALAGFAPAWRAARIPPIEAMRNA